MSNPDSPLPTPIQTYTTYPSPFARTTQPKPRIQDDVFLSPTQKQSLLPSIQVQPTQTRSNLMPPPPLPTPRTLSFENKRTNSNPYPTRPIPPPILVRRPTDMGNRIDKVNPPSADSPTKPTSPFPQPIDPPSPSGLNILGLPRTRESSISDNEEDPSDSLKELRESIPFPSPSPRRAAFRAGLSLGGDAPLSPAWQGMNSPNPSTNIYGGSPSPPGVSSARFRGDVPPSPLGRGGRFDPTPQHGIHARNLSLYFPQPGQGQGQGGGMLEGGTGMVMSPEMVEGKNGERKVFGGTGDWSFGQPAEEVALETPDAKKGKRRGHHHKHSLSHNFFSFLDPTTTNPALSHTHSYSSQSPKPSDTPQSVPMPQLTSSTSTALLPTPTHTKSNPPTDPYIHFLASFAVLEFMIGAGLWVEGQMSGWRCLAGVGYLVVFDSLGVGVGVVAREKGDGGLGLGSFRRPYGTARLAALMYFAQSLFLVFAAVYIAKESIEQVVLGSEAHEHGSHGHGDSMGEGDERPFPLFLLACGALAGMFGGGVLGNHQSLVDAVGTLFLPSRYVYSATIQKAGGVFVNPFSLSVVGSCLAIVLGSVTVAPTSLHTLDSTLSLGLTILTLSLSLPPTKVFAHTLLQTAPPTSASQMIALRRVLRDLGDDRRILSNSGVRCWTVSAGGYDARNPVTPLGSIANTPLGSPQTPTFGRGMGSGLGLESRETSPTRSTRLGGGGNPFVLREKEAGGSTGTAGGKTDLVVTMNVHVKEEASDEEVLEVTRVVYGRIVGCLGGGADITIGVKRGAEGGDEE